MDISIKCDNIFLRQRGDFLTKRHRPQWNRNTNSWRPNHYCEKSFEIKNAGSCVKYGGRKA